MTVAQCMHMLIAVAGVSEREDEADTDLGTIRRSINRNTALTPVTPSLVAAAGLAASQTDHDRLTCQLGKPMPWPASVSPDFDGAASEDKTTEAMAPLVSSNVVRAKARKRQLSYRTFR